MDPATISQAKPVDYETANHVADITDNETYDEDFHDEEDNFTFRNKTKKLIRPEKSLSVNTQNKLCNTILLYFLTLRLIIK